MTSEATDAGARIHGVSAERSRAAGARRDKAASNWRTDYARGLWITDSICIVGVIYLVQIFWFGRGSAYVTTAPDSPLPAVPYWLASGIIALAWIWALALADSRSPRVVGYGGLEYMRVADASLRLFGAMAIMSFLLKVELARGYLLIALPVGILVLEISRWLWRRWLIRKRKRNEYCSRVLLIGSARSVTDIALELHRTPQAGYLVVGACMPTDRVADVIPGTTIPVMGNVQAVGQAMKATNADTIIVTSTDELPADKVKQISWSLEAGRQHLVIAPSLADIAGPRIHTRPVAGLPLIHVETPRFSRGQILAKRTLDVVAAGLAVLILSPLLITLAILVRTTSPGPVLFRQRRVGLRGEEFTMLKFRSMVVNAEELLAELVERERDAGNSVLFKMKHDPRVTRVGRFMRKFSLDELPQLFNVIGGSMSLVGPRPPLPSEVAVYEDHVHRRFLAKPGITGLWQVSGRSTLSWEESVRLDLSYVENWTLIGDFGILLKTVRAVLAPGETAH